MMPKERGLHMQHTHVPFNSPNHGILKKKFSYLISYAESYAVCSTNLPVQVVTSLHGLLIASEIKRGNCNISIL